MSDQASGSRFNTLAIHAGRRPQSGDDAGFEIGGGDFGPIGAHAVSFARRLLDTDAAGQPSSGTSQAVLEERIAALDGGSAALAVASGQMARLVALHALLQPGDEIVVSRQPSREQAILEQSFKSFGWHARTADPDKPESFVEALSDKTKSILIDSISDGGAITDIEAIARVAQRARLPLVVDNSFATPVLVRPVELGADVVIYSRPRLLCGLASSAGLIVDGGSFDWADDLRYPALATPVGDGSDLIIAEAFGNFAFAIACRLLNRRDFGGALPPPPASCLTLGIATLPLRIQRHCDNALAIARHLQQHQAVARVHYAGLASERGPALMQRLCPAGAGAVLSFQLAGGGRAETRLLERLRLLSAQPRATDREDIGDTRTTAAAIAYGDASSAIRLSAGLEDSGDLVADLDQAMAG